MERAKHLGQKNVSFEDTQFMSAAVCISFGLLPTAGNGVTKHW